jgi:predicted ATPase/DNA-binding SARP family transcriptional activator
MPRLIISLFGFPHISLDGTPIEVRTVRAIPLMAYLAIEGGSQSRESVANLLWTDVGQTQALAALRTTLWRLKSAGLAAWIKIDRDTITLTHLGSIQIDIVDFQDLLDKCTHHGHPPTQVCPDCLPLLAEAVELYQGEFMAGYNLSKAPAFDEWRMQQSELLQTFYFNALERLVKGHRTFGDINQAIQYARRWLVSDRLNEDVHLQLMQLYGSTGQRAAAIAQYRHFKNTLSRELGLEPSEEITSVYKHLLSGKAIPRASEVLVSPIFLIADIEKVASSWDQDGLQRKQILDQYTQIVKDTALRFGGHIIQQTEDNITILFEKGQPLHCAVASHRNFKRADWGLAGPPDIRMALYAASVNNDRSTNFASITHIASTLLSISWGGQIVFTDQTLRCLDLPMGSRISDLGVHLLKDVEEPVHVYELLHPHLISREHPPLQSITQHLPNIPTQFPPFIGRETELNDLTRLLGSPDCRLISLVGPGGVGKTRLAIQLASQQVEHFTDGIYFIPLAPIQNPEHIPITLAEVLKFSFYGAKNLFDQLFVYLHRKHILLIFDNFEHLIKGNEFLTDLLSATHKLKILVTSRERLNLISETIFEVPGLHVPPAEETEFLENYSSIALFLQNAQRISPGFNIKNNQRAIIRICQLVDGLPLGIMLASSWVRALNCQEIAIEIENNIDFLETSAPDIPTRHRSLRAVFDHSWQLLSEEDRRILPRLSIFPGAFTSEAAQEVSKASPLALAVFVDKSLLRRGQGDRYEMLETFHQYAFGKLEAIREEYLSTLERYCDYYAGFLVKKQEEINTPTQRQALNDIIEELENIRAAWSWAVEHDRWGFINRVKEPLLAFHVMVGHFNEGREFFQIALLKLNGLSDPALDLLRASMQQREAWMAFRIGHLHEGVDRLNKSLSTFRALGSQWDIALTLMFLAEANRTFGNYQAGKEVIEEGLQILLSGNLPRSNYVLSFTAHCQSVLGAILIEMGKYDEAQTILQASLNMHGQLGTRYGSIHPLSGLGKLANIRGDYLKSRDLFLQALSIAMEMSDQRGVAVLQNNLSDISDKLGNEAEAYQYLISALTLFKKTGDRRLTAIGLNNLAYHQLKVHQNYSEAISHYYESIDLFTHIGDLRGMAYTFYDLSKVYLKLDSAVDARQCCSQALSAAISHGSTPLILHALLGYVDLFAFEHEYERALRLCYLVLNHPQTEPDTRQRANASLVEIEPLLPPDKIEAARLWGQSTRLQEIIDQTLAEIVLQ